MSEVHHLASFNIEGEDYLRMTNAMLAVISQQVLVKRLIQLSIQVKCLLSTFSHCPSPRKRQKLLQALRGTLSRRLDNVVGGKY